MYVHVPVYIRPKENPGNFNSVKSNKLSGHIPKT